MEKNFRKRSILLTEINYRFIADFDSFLRAHQPVGHQKPINNNGVMKHMVRLQKMINLAIRLEWMSNDPFKNYKIKIHKVDKDFLNLSELQAIEEKEFSIERLQIVKDIFCFLLLHRAGLC